MATEPFVSVPLEGGQDDSSPRGPARAGLTMRQPASSGFFTPALVSERHHDHHHHHPHVDHHEYQAAQHTDSPSAHFIPISQLGDGDKSSFDLMLGDDDKPAAKKSQKKAPTFFLLRYVFNLVQFLGMFSKYVYTLWRSRETRTTLLFVFLLLAFIVVQFYYAAETESLAITANGCRFLLEVALITVGLVNLVVTKHHPATKDFSYGLERFELVYAFSMGVFLIFLCLYIAFDALERVLEPSHLHLSGQESYAVGASSLVFNLISFLFFRNQKHIRAEARGSLQRGVDMSSSSSSSSADAAIHDDQLLSFLLEAAASLAVIVSSWIGTTTGWHGADALCGVLIGLVIFRGALPLCTLPGLVLLQTTPRTLREQLAKALREAAMVEGVLECSNEHFWTFAPGVFVGSLHARVRSEANEQLVRQKLRGLFAQIPLASFTVQIEKDSDPWPLNVAVVGGGALVGGPTMHGMAGGAGNTIGPGAMMPNGIVGGYMSPMSTYTMDAGSTYTVPMMSPLS